MSIQRAGATAVQKQLTAICSINGAAIQCDCLHSRMFEALPESAQSWLSEAKVDATEIQNRRGFCSKWMLNPVARVSPAMWKELPTVEFLSWYEQTDA